MLLFRYKTLLFHQVYKNTIDLFGKTFVCRNFRQNLGSIKLIHKPSIYFILNRSLEP